ncbi:glycoside hydrolase family 5 protein [Mucilaginibacter sp. BT774]|uniref:glycoside hydrolase family 5 protein n=1 Tax=Mucilaginibacter sp. BT774 TaxID=3062276 RepID=UPI0026765323|nr:glycoside hydrolase family 5 protein [Mucilaginibacter sp. BT774]MDO3626596.1 glycoside hydrolase family 5 protein [Mucilaginibacter sp. BT774]
MVSLLTLFIAIGCEAQSSNNQSAVFKRAQSLDNGVSIPWLEQTWNKNILDSNVISTSDFRLLKQLGFKCIRLPVAFRYFQTNNSFDPKLFERIDQIIRLCHLYGFKVVICYHSGNLDENTYASESQSIISLWKMLAKKYYLQSADDLFFELYNEPPHMNPDTWQNAANEIIKAIRKVDAKRTLIVGASNFNSIYELSRSTPLNDDNIIYTFHFYEPFFFTHQGAEWIGDQVATTGVPFPYNAENFPPLNPKAKNTWGETNYYQYRTDGNEQSVKDKLQIVKNWGLKYNVPLLCGEYGVYNKYADPDSRCRYIKAVRQTLKVLHIPGILWDYNSNFSIFNGKPSLSDLPDCMKDALNYNRKN